MLGELPEAQDELPLGVPPPQKSGPRGRFQCPSFERPGRLGLGLAIVKQALAMPPLKDARFDLPRSNHLPIKVMHPTMWQVPAWHTPKGLPAVTQQQ